MLKIFFLLCAIAFSANTHTAEHNSKRPRNEQPGWKCIVDHKGGLNPLQPLTPCFQLYQHTQTQEIRQVAVRSRVDKDGVPVELTHHHLYKKPEVLVREAKEEYHGFMRQIWHQTGALNEAYAKACTELFQYREKMFESDQSDDKQATEAVLRQAKALNLISLEVIMELKSLQEDARQTTPILNMLGW